MEFTNKKWQQLQEEKIRNDEKKTNEEKEEAIKRGKNRLQLPEFNDGRMKHHNRSSIKQRGNSHDKSMHNGQYKPSTDNTGIQNNIKGFNAPNKLNDNSKNISHKAVQYNQRNITSRYNSDNTLNHIFKDRFPLETQKEEIAKQPVKPIVREMSFSELQKGAIQIPLGHLVDLINLKIDEQTAEHRDKKKHGKYPEDEVSFLLNRIHYLNEHYILSSNLKAELLNISDNIKDTDHRLQVKQQITMMQDVTSYNKKSKPKPIIYSLPIEHDQLNEVRLLEF